MIPRTQSISAATLIGFSLVGGWAMNGPALGQDAMFVDDQGRVGVGTGTPQVPLHVLRSDGSANVRVEETSGTAATRSLLDLRNNGEVKFQIKNTNTGDLWDFSNRTNGFNITLRGTGGQEFLIEQDGTFQVGPGGSANLVVYANGDARLPNGTLTEGSSREVKAAIEPLSGRRVVEQLDRLEVAEWSYEGQSQRHAGPMAEDFYALFGLGPDNKHIAPKDLAGVALAGVKGLKERLAEQRAAFEAKLQEKDQRLEALAAQNERLAQQNASLVADNAALTERVANMEAQLGELKQAVAKIAGPGSARVAALQ